MEPSIERLSSLIARLARQKCRVNNVRIRFVDYSGKLLVPEEILGVIADSRLMAVREFNQCIVGLAATRMKVQYVNDLQENEFFKEFLESVEEKARYDPNSERWRDYAEVLKGLKSEIAVPIIIGKLIDPSEIEYGNGPMEPDEKENLDYDKLIGVLNINSSTGSLTIENVNTLIEFSKELSLAFSLRNSSLLNQLHDIEIQMMSVYNRNDVAQLIADGLKLFFKNSIPNIYLYDEKSNGNPFTFLAAAKAERSEIIIGSFLPRWNNSSAGQGLGESLIKDYQRGHIDRTIGVIYDVANDDRAGLHAKEQKIKSVWCQLLIFQGKIVGLLYIHFRKKIKFLTREEKKILELFAHTAAIAIKNATVTQGFNDLYGHEFLDYIENEAKYLNEQTPSSLNEEVLVLLDELRIKLENARGNSEIVLSIIQGMNKIGKIIGMPEKLFEILSRFQKYEELILYNVPNYRDHFIHMFFVYSTGFLVIHKWIKQNAPFIKKHNKDISNWMRSWFICATLHDVAYPVSNVEKWIPQFPSDTLDLPCKIKASFDWSSFVIPTNTDASMNALSAHFASLNKDLPKAQDRFRQWFNKQLLETHDHGALGALAIMNIPWDNALQNNALDAALAVALHNYVKEGVNAPLGQLKIKEFLLAFLLTYCDFAQEWGRPSGNIPSEVEEFNEIRKHILFNDLNVGDGKTINSTTLLINYRPNNPKNIDDSRKKEIEIAIKSKIFNYLTNYKNTWTDDDFGYTFKLSTLALYETNRMQKICDYSIP